MTAALVLMLLAAPAAQAATVSGNIADGRLDVRFSAEPGERSELRVLPHPTGVRFAGSGPLVAGDHCLAVSENDVRCGPPGPSGLGVFIRSGDGDDAVFTRMAGVALTSLALGSGDDIGRGGGLVRGGPGDDDLRALGLRGGLFHAGPGEDVLAGGPRRDVLDGGPGPDLAVGGRKLDELVGGRGPDQLAGGLGRDFIWAGPGDDRIRATDHLRDHVRCGPGRDVAYVSRRDVTTGCERIVLGWRP